MSTLDEITQEKQRVSEALARIDAQREKLASELGELEATERVLARYSKGAPARRTGSARTATNLSPLNASGPPRSQRVIPPVRAMRHLCALIATAFANRRTFRRAIAR